MLDKNKKGIFEDYKDEIITKDELSNRVKMLEEKKAPLIAALSKMRCKGTFGSSLKK